AILLAATGPVSEWGLKWLAWDLTGKVLIGSALGIAIGWGLARVAFRSSRPSLRTADSGEPLLAVAAVLLSYGVAEVAGGYGFLAVFACAMTLRSSERGHDYHALMHEVVERLERLLTLIVLLLLGVALTHGLLDTLTWPAVVVVLLLIFVIRPLSGLVALQIGLPRGRPRVGDGRLDARERLAVAFFGVRGIGSIYYLAYAAGHADFDDLPLLWSAVGFAITVSVIVHGVSATPAMRWLDRQRERSA
ncbi:MAG: cation transporter, partial [Aeromicrobium sp.]|nr:cation transporter [Aeromicrobium sp.]